MDSMESEHDNTSSGPHMHHHKHHHHHHHHHHHNHGEDCEECSLPVQPPGPGTSFLEVIPEASALYSPHRTVRKRKSKELSEKNVNWKRYRDNRQISLESTSGDVEVESESSSSSSEDEGIYSRPKFSPSKFYHDVVHQIDTLMKDFQLKDETYIEIMKLLDIEMDRGLGAQTNPSATLKMFPTYVRALPDGTEFGEFLALDLGGTNFRVLRVKLNGTETPEVKSRTYLIPKAIMLGSGTLLFDHIATCISKFLSGEGLKGRHWVLGFTFSFPCIQDGLASARLVRWTKGFRCEGVEGEDVVRLLHEAIQRKKNLDIECIALINDPVGALMATAHKDKSCLVGLILGTGTNACYMEQLGKVGTWDGNEEEPKQVIVNTEWGAFGDNGVLQFIRNDFDEEVDSHSLNPGHQLFEKMISGMYMGEIVRLILVQLTADGFLFGGEGSDYLYTRNMFLTKYISEIESDDPSGNFENTKMILQELELGHFSIDDCRHVQHVCWQVSSRAAFLAGTAVATVINRLDHPEVTVGVDGSLYRFHPHFADLMNKKISQLIKPERKFKLVTSTDGSGKGAALVAAVAQRERDNTLTDVDIKNNNPSSTETKIDPALIINVAQEVAI